MNEMVVIIYTNDKTYQTGTTDELNKLLSNSDGVNGIIDIQTDDHNNDGVAEEITVNIGLTGVTPSEVKSIVLLQSFNYGISVSEQWLLKIPHAVLFVTLYLLVYRKCLTQRSNCRSSQFSRRPTVLLSYTPRAPSEWSRSQLSPWVRSSAKSTSKRTTSPRTC